MNDDYSPAAFKALCASLGIQTYAKTDAFGRPEVMIDREGLNRLIELGVLPEDPSNLPSFQEAARKRKRESGE